MKKFILLLALMPSSVFAGGHWFSSSTVWNAQADATSGNANGCACDPITETNESCASIFQADAELTVTDMVIGANPKTVSSVASPFLSTHTGYYLHITAGSGFVPVWAKIMDVTLGVATLNNTAGAAASTGGTGRVGGACSTIGDTLFETLGGGNTFYIRGDTGDYTIGGSIVVTTSANTANPVNIVGYKTTIDDAPTLDDRPFIDFGTNACTLGANFNIRNLRIISTGAGGTFFTLGSGGAIANNMQVYNNSATAGRIGFATGAGSRVSRVEVQCLNGTGINLATNTRFTASSVHHSSHCVILGTSDSVLMSDNLLYMCNSSGVFVANTGTDNFIGYNTIVGSITSRANSSGIVIMGLTPTGSQDTTITGNIVSGFNVGIEVATRTPTNEYTYNNWHNNTSLVSPNDIVELDSTNTYLDPQFTDTIHDDYRIGTNLKAGGVPGQFGDTTTVGYKDLGGVQREEQGSSGTRGYPIGN